MLTRSLRPTSRETTHFRTQICTGAKYPTVTSYNDALDAIVDVECPECRDEFLGHCSSERIVLPGAVERQNENWCRRLARFWMMRDLDFFVW